MKVIQIATAVMPEDDEDEACMVLFALTDDGAIFILRQAENDWSGQWERVAPISVQDQFGEV
jgi:hypothetical protein